MGTGRDAKELAMTQSILTASVARPANDAAVIVLDGPLDLGTTVELDRLIHGEVSSGHHRVVMDLANVTFCDSTGVSALLRAHRIATASGGWVRMTGISDQVRRVLQSTNVDRVLRRFPTIEAAFGA
jgi:anti-sigma B factor antagonist